MNINWYTMGMAELFIPIFIFSIIISIISEVFHNKSSCYVILILPIMPIINGIVISQRGISSENHTGVKVFALILSSLLYLGIAFAGFGIVYKISEVLRRGKK